MANEPSSGNILIRQAEASDFEVVFDLLGQLWPTSKLNKDDIMNTYLSILNSKDHITVCAVSNHKVVGLGTLSIKKSLYAQGNLAHLDELVVDGNYRSKGIGKKLLDALTKEAIDRRCTLIELDSAMYRDNAHKFYEREGFKKTAYVLTEFF
jgi:PhnO protein